MPTEPIRSLVASMMWVPPDRWEEAPDLTPGHLPDARYYRLYWSGGAVVVSADGGSWWEERP